MEGEEGKVEEGRKGRKLKQCNTRTTCCIIGTIETCCQY